jgi:hypothetical protein
MATAISYIVTSMFSGIIESGISPSDNRFPMGPSAGYPIIHEVEATNQDECITVKESR